MKNLILTGCAGFIGFNFLKHALASGVAEEYDNVYSIDKLGYAAFYNIKEYEELCDANNIHCVSMPIANLADGYVFTFDSDEEKVDVLNFASESHVDRSIDSPSSIFMENAAIPSQLIDAIGVDRINKWIQISTDEVYGELPLDTESSKWFKVGDNFHPNNPYSASKAAQDMYLLSMEHTFNLNLQFIRLANQFGPHQHPEKMLPATIIRAFKGESIKIYGTGDNIRQWTPVTHSVKVIYDQLMNDSVETVFIAKMYVPLLTNNEIVEAWRSELLNQYNVTTEIEYIEDRKGHDTMYALQTTEEVDAVFLETTLEQEFAATIKFYHDNLERYIES